MASRSTARKSPLAAASPTVLFSESSSSALRRGQVPGCSGALRDPGVSMCVYI